MILSMMLSGQIPNNSNIRLKKKSRRINVIILVQCSHHCYYIDGNMKVVVLCGPVLTSEHLIIM